MEGAFEAAQPVVTQLLKAETAERQVRAVTHELKQARTGGPQPRRLSLRAQRVQRNPGVRNCLASSRDDVMKATR